MKSKVASALPQLLLAVLVLAIVASLESLSPRLPVRPGPRAFATGQDRANEKTLFTSLSIPVPEFAVVRTLDDLRTAARRVGAPSIMKTCRMGYDGKGQARLDHTDDASLAAAWQDCNVAAGNTRDGGLISSLFRKLPAL